MCRVVLVTSREQRCGTWTGVFIRVAAKQWTHSDDAETCEFSSGVHTGELAALGYVRYG